MHRSIRWLALGSAVLLLAACSHPNKNEPLAFAPADTPYVVANLKPFTKEAQAALSPASASTTVWAAKVAQLQGLAGRLDADHQPHLANVVRVILDTAHGRTYAQFEAQTGIDVHGLFAVYGLGLSPVGRGPLSDPAKFKTWFAKLTKAYGKPFTKATLDGRSYQHLVLGKSGLQLLIATHDKHFVGALLPATPSSTQLRLVLGLDRPKQSLQDTQRLAKLAKAEGYGSYFVGYLDTTKLPALVAGLKDPLLQITTEAMTRKVVAKRNAEHQTSVSSSQIVSKMREMLPAACKPGLARIAARVPLISFGFTKLAPTEKTEQVDIHLAPDIVKAFKNVGTQVPGLGKASSAPLDLAMALPVPAFRKFWLAQAEAVAAKPFICPALSSLNKMFAKLQTALPKTAMPPFGDLRGFRLVLDQVDLSDMQSMHTGKLPKLQARVLVASHNPVGLWQLAKASIPPLAQLTLDSNGKPAALPAKMMAKAGQPGWVAMNGKALAIGIGQGEEQRLSPMLSAATAPAGTLLHIHMTGQLYRHWLKAIDQEMTRAQAAGKPGAHANQAVASAHSSMQSAIAALRHIKDFTGQVTLTDQGIRIRSDMRVQQ